MIIQELQFPQETICPIWGMYFHKQKKFPEVGVSEIRLEAGEILSLDSYYNSFSVGKWKKYTKLDNLRLELEVSGKVRIKAYHALGKIAEKDRYYEFYHLKDYYGRADIREIDREVAESGGRTEIIFPELFDEGVLYVTLEALEDITFYGGRYVSDVEEQNFVRIALGICTFRREDFVIPNVNKVIAELIENQQSPMYHHLEIYIADNGQTLPKDTFGNQNVHLYPNSNVGGTGGFTRDMIEAVIRRSTDPFTHFIIMDDDIILNPHVLERTYIFLELLKDEYADMILSGALYDIEHRNIQYLSGEYFGSGKTTTHNKIWDMTNFDAVAANEVEKKNNYGGWWYCCTPVCHITEDNLPIPLFIHQDDIEFGLRNSKDRLLLLNGINVWHVQGMGKGSASVAYYDMRNWLIASAAYDHARVNVEQVLGKLTEEFLGGVIRYHYLSFDYTIMGLKAFLEGPEAFMELDAEKNHKKLLGMCYKYQTPEEVGVDLENIRDRGFENMPKINYFLDAFCWLLPGFRKPVVCTLHDCGLPYLHKSLYIYDASRKAGVLSKRNYREAFRCLKNYLEMRRRVKKELVKMQRIWVEKKPQYTNYQFWLNYLNLEG